MCTVQVLVFADVMRPFPQEQVSTMGALRPISQGVRRRLFADELGARVDSKPFLNAALADLQKKDKEKWNFDFVTEKPLPGRYQWIPMCPEEPRVPKTNVTAQTEVRLPTKSDNLPTSSRSELQKENCAAVAEYAPATSPVERLLASPQEKSATFLKFKSMSQKSQSGASRKRKSATRPSQSSTKQLKITDYLQHRKRSQISDSPCPKFKSPRLERSRDVSSTSRTRPDECTWMID